MSGDAMEEAGLPRRRAKLKYLADALKSYAVALTGAALITPAFTPQGVGAVNLVWLIVALTLLAYGLIITPED